MSGEDRVRRLSAAALTMGLALFLAGCGGSGSSGSSTATATSTGAATAPAPSTTTSSRTGVRHKRRQRAVHGPRVGARQGVHTDGAYLTVRILRVLTLTHTGSPTLPGTRQVGVELRIANQAGTTYDSTASGDLSLVLSAGQSVPLAIRRGPCATPLQDFESILSAGSVRVGCVAFSVPRRARVIGVRFSPHSRPRGTLTWRIG